MRGGIFINSEIQTLIASVGFPIALSMYLLIRIEGKLQTLSDSINELSKNINIMKFK
ncbi:YvrJ family protein [Paraclostridium sordellii]|uniref:YvrJ family protein n=1 Tax=Paraclostridium sordellii TaxID=1505 RepID=UPI003A7F271A